VESAKEICEEPNALALLTDLTDRSLARVTESHGSKRIRLLESIRQFAQESADHQRHERLSVRHANHFERLASEVGPYLRMRNQANWVQRLEVEDDNFRQALTWRWASGDAAGAARLMCRLSRYWEHVTRNREASEWFEQVVHCEFDDLGLKAEVACTYARCRLRGSSPPSVTMPILERALDLSRQAGRQDLEAAAIYGLSHVYFQLAKSAEAIARFETALRMFEDLGNGSGVGDCLINIGELETRRGNLARAVELWKKGLAVSEEAGDVRNIAVLNANLGEYALARGEYAEAQRLSELARDAFQAIDERSMVGNLFLTLGRLAMIDGRAHDARRFFQDASRIYASNSIDRTSRGAQWALAELDWRSGHWEQAEARYRKVLSGVGFTDSPVVASWLGMARIAVERGDPKRAVGFLKECLSRGSEHVHARDGLLIIELTALCIGLAGRPAEGARLLGSAEAVRRAIGQVRDPIDLKEHEALVKLLDSHRLSVPSTKGGQAPGLTALAGEALRELLVAWPE
jgi:tetratricopeptide (TPR) repeat protein